MQKKDQSPGRQYDGTTQMAYLPDNKEGQKILKLLKEAFKKRLLFAIYESAGQADQVMWTVHHKTSTIGGGRYRSKTMEIMYSMHSGIGTWNGL